MAIPCMFAIDGVIEYVNNGVSLSRMIGIPLATPMDLSSADYYNFDVTGRVVSTFGGPNAMAMFLAVLVRVRPETS